MGLSLRRQQMAAKKDSAHTRRGDEVADFEYRRDVAADIEDLLAAAEPYIVPAGPELSSMVAVDQVLLKKVAEDITRYITT